MPRVEFARSLSVSAPAEQVWEAVTDAQRVADWISLVSDVTEVAHLAHYTATLSDRVGPFRLSADLDIAVKDIDPPRTITFSADGEDRQVSSRIRVDASLTLTPALDGCEIQVAGMYEVTGRVATLGASAIRAKAETVMNEFFQALEKDLG